jgi:ribosomal-protein-alanine N-acetyltransferase
VTALVDIIGVGEPAAAMLASLHAASFSRPGDETWSRRSFADVLKMPGAVSFVAQVETAHGPSPVGFCVCRVAPPESELLTIGVLPDYRSRGTARQLIARAAEECRSRGSAELFLEVAEDNPGAQALYQSLGFRQVGRRPGYYLRLENRRVDALTMRLPLV